MDVKCIREALDQLEQKWNQWLVLGDVEEKEREKWASGCTGPQIPHSPNHDLPPLASPNNFN